MSHWNWDVGAVRIHPRPLESVMAPLEIQNEAADPPRPMRFCPSESCPTAPLAPPDAVKVKQQSFRERTAAEAPRAKPMKVKDECILCIV